MAIHNQKVDSSDTPIFAAAKTMDRHATATQCLASERKNAASKNAVSLEKVDSREAA